MATNKQKMALGKVVENGGNISKAMVEVGYSMATAKNPKNLTESLGYKELCEEYGLTEQLIITSLVDDIIKKPGDRVSELLLASKLLGLLDRAKRETDKQVPGVPILANMPNEVLEKYAIYGGRSGFEPTKEEKEEIDRALRDIGCMTDKELGEVIIRD